MSPKFNPYIQGFLITLLNNVQELKNMLNEEIESNFSNLKVLPRFTEKMGVISKLPPPPLV